jgi:hypothetical protein
MVRDDFERVMCGPGARGLYESNYLKANEPGGAGAFWIKFNLLAPTDPARPRFAELWAAAWEGAGRRPVVVKQIVEDARVATDPGRLRLSTPQVSLDPGRAEGAVEDGGHRIAWKLDLLEGDTPLFHFPSGLLYTLPFPKKKILTPRPRQLFRGVLEVDDRRFEVERWVGIRGHNWGTEHAHTYAYGNANLWDRPGEWMFDAFSARISLGPAVSPWLSVAVLRLPRAELRTPGNPYRWLNPTATVDFPTWACTFRHQAGTARARWSLDPEDVAGLRYLHPDGRVSYCYNTKFATLQLELDRRGAREHRVSRLAELEFLTPSPIPGIPLHGHDLLPG